MDKKKVWISLAILITILITGTLIVITLGIGRNGGTGTDSSGMPIGTFFIIFVLPGIIAHQKKKKEQMKNKNNLGEM